LIDDKLPVCTEKLKKSVRNSEDKTGAVFEQMRIYGSSDSANSEIWIHDEICGMTSKLPVRPLRKVNELEDRRLAIILV
jgi:hypothetical protein